MIDYDLELQCHNRELRLAYGIGPSDHVLDIGCGTGQTTCDAARFASCGSVLGLDQSKEMIDRARERTREEGIKNVTYECADVEQYPHERFDVAISRFGTMFFADPVVAFSNIGRALQRNGRLVMMVWQNRENEWAMLMQRALASEGSLPEDRAATLPAFSLGDPAIVQRVLNDAGFADVTFADVHEPVYYGVDANAALAFVMQFSTVQETLRSLSDTASDRLIGRLRHLMATQHRCDGVWLDSRAWIVSARRA